MDHLDTMKEKIVQFRKFFFDKKPAFIVDSNKFQIKERRLSQKIKNLGLPMNFGAALIKKFDSSIKKVTV